MTRLYGRAPTGQRVAQPIPTATWHTTTMIAAIARSGACAPFVLEGALDGQSFGVYVERVLAPELKPGDVVVLDNLSSHKNPHARGLIAAAGAQICDLPPYSPDLNPIEKMWSKVKAFLRQVQARSPEELCAAVGQALQTVTRSDSVGWFKSCGYDII